ncbi:MAG: GAF domain-containing protein [Proteobacteria bacterium]|nr:GAF domain-containing protein [Pseudomonadota bacterium]
MTAAYCIEQLRRSLEGILAAIISTCDSEGVPNVSMISQVYYVDADHVALSYQFFNKTRRNLLATRRAAVQIADPATLQHHRLDLEFVETQTTGPVFERMKAQLAGIASHHGMESVFRLLGADIFRVTGVSAVPGSAAYPPQEAKPLMTLVRRSFAALDRCTDLERLLDCASECLERDFGIRHSILLMAEEDQDRLYTVASRGYPTSGAGAEVAFGEGVIGVAARENTPICINFFTSDYRYSAAVTDSARRLGIVAEAARAIPFPGLAEPQSQIALPITAAGRLLGVLFAESESVMAFGYEDEDALALIASHLGARMIHLQPDAEETEVAVPPAPVATERTVAVRYYAFDQSIFLDNDYLIKGVAGAILWRLLSLHHETGRTEFSLRELRVDPVLRLPTHSENLDARLILLRRRLEERGACLQIQKCGRGRMRLVVDSRLTLEEIPSLPA